MAPIRVGGGGGDQGMFEILNHWETVFLWIECFFEWFFFLLFAPFLFWQVERDFKNFPEVKRSKGMERREFNDYNEEEDK